MGVVVFDSTLPEDVEHRPSRIHGFLACGIAVGWDPCGESFGVGALTLVSTQWREGKCQEHCVSYDRFKVEVLSGQQVDVASVGEDSLAVGAVGHVHLADLEVEVARHGFEATSTLTGPVGLQPAGNRNLASPDLYSQREGDTTVGHVDTTDGQVVEVDLEVNLSDHVATPPKGLDGEQEVPGHGSNVTRRSGSCRRQPGSSVSRS